MAGAILETYVLGELLKSWWHRGKTPQLYYYRDRDNREIDFLFLQDGVAYPVEVKRSACPNRDRARPFATLAHQKQDIGHGSVLCLCD